MAPPSNSLLLKPSTAFIRFIWFIEGGSTTQVTIRIYYTKVSIDTLVLIAITTDT